MGFGIGIQIDLGRVSKIRSNIRKPLCLGMRELRVGWKYRNPGYSIDIEHITGERAEAYTPHSVSVSILPAALE
jgi:hypothetical protein